MRLWPWRPERRPDWPKEVHQQYLVALEERDKEVERADALDDAIGDALDLATGWTLQMTDAQRLNRIAAGLNKAIREHGTQNRPKQGDA